MPCGRRRATHSPALLSRFETSQSVFDAAHTALLEVDGVGPKIAAAILAARHTRCAEDELAQCRELGIDLILRDDARYPQSLARICDPPGVLYCRGTLEPRDELAVAIVGSRRCTVYGRQQAERLAGACAGGGHHRQRIGEGDRRGGPSRLEAGGRTLAVMGTGLKNIYPPEHGELAAAVAKQGALWLRSRSKRPRFPAYFRSATGSSPVCRWGSSWSGVARQRRSAHGAALSRTGP